MLLVLWLLAGSPGGLLRAQAASEHLPSEEGRRSGSRVDTCLSPSREAIEARPDTGSQGGLAV